MGSNRRNFYRILHVQPEAPGPVITVVGCRSVGQRVEVSGSLLKAIFANQKGVVVSVRT